MNCSNNTVIVLHDEVLEHAQKDELDTLEEVHAVSKVLSGLGFNTIQVPFSPDVKKVIHKLKEINPIFVFNLVESVLGEGSLCFLAPYIFDYLNIKYTGCPTEAMILTTNKITTKKLLKQYGISTPEWVSIDEDNGFIPNRKYIIKATNEDASIGLAQDSIIFASTYNDITKKLTEKTEKMGKDFFAERFIDGREFNVSILGSSEFPNVLEPVEMKFFGFEENNKEKIICYRAKWEEGTFEYDNIRRVSDFGSEDTFLINKLKNISELCWNKFKLKGYARVDFRVDEDGEIWVLEINTNPCITPAGSSFVSASTQAGLSYDQVIEKIITAVS